MLEIKNISKSFDKKQLFKDFNLMIEDGDFLIISGESGCGKTTLLNMIGSIEKPNNGDILVDSFSVFDKKFQRKYLREKVGFLFQNFALVDEKSVKYNFDLVKGTSKSNVTYSEALSFVNLSEDVLSQKIYSLSGGEQQRVAIARLLIKRCDIILADEPTASLDRKNANDIFELLSTINKQGKTIIVASHDESMQKYAGGLVKL